MENTKFKVYVENKSQGYAKFLFEPLERGYGDTLGNALRRVLLSSIRGTAITAVKIDGVLHEFSTVKGVREDVIEILMNLKHIPIKANFDLAEGEHKEISIDARDLPRDFFKRSKNPGVLTAEDMPSTNEIEFIGDGVICTLEPTAKLSMELYIEQGSGYKMAERDRPSYLPINAIMTDSIFSPVLRVNYKVEPARVGQSIERLILEVWTNDSITPSEAVEQAAATAQEYFAHIAETVKDAPEMKERELPKEKPLQVEVNTYERELFKRPIHELELTIRSENCLLRGGIQTIGDLLQKTRDDLLKIRNLGKISLSEILEKIESMNLSLKKSENENQSYFEESDSDEDIQEQDEQKEDSTQQADFQVKADEIFESASQEQENEEPEEKPDLETKPMRLITLR